MSREGAFNISPIMVLIGGFIALLYTFYFMQQLSYSIGVYSGISSSIRAYNISNKTAGSDLLAAISQSTTLVLALHLTYVLLPFAVLISAIGVIWLFARSYSRFAGTILVISSIIYLIIVAILEFDFSFKNAAYAFPIAYIGGILALAAGVYPILRNEMRAPFAKRAMHPIAINPETPYSNMRILSNKLMKRLTGKIRILDMHFDVKSLDNLMQLVEGNIERYSEINVLTKADRLGLGFEKSYSDFKNELTNRNVAFELRVLKENQAEKQHERILMDNNAAYKIPPINIINKKSEHIVSINHKEAHNRFEYLWAEATKFENLKTAA